MRGRQNWPIQSSLLRGHGKILNGTAADGLAAMMLDSLSETGASECMAKMRTGSVTPKSHISCREV